MHASLFSAYLHACMLHSSFSYQPTSKRVDGTDAVPFINEQRVNGANAVPFNKQRVNGVASRAILQSCFACVISCLNSSPSVNTFVGQRRTLAPHLDSQIPQVGG